MKVMQYENKLYKPIALVYVGEGITISGIPARDLTPEEVKKYGGRQKLVETGLYTSQAEALEDGGT